MTMRPSCPKRIGVVLTPGFSLMSVASLIEPMRAANMLLGAPAFDITFIQAEQGPVRATAGAAFEGPFLDQAVYDFDLVFVGAAGNPALMQMPALDRYLKLLNAKRVALGGISGGPVLLARAGVMKNRRFTVHWDHREVLRELSDELLIERSIYVIDRDRYTCAGGVAALDMMSAIITRDHGAEAAKRVNDWLIHTWVRKADDPQTRNFVETYNVQNPVVLGALQLMHDHVAEPLPLTELAGLTGVSNRQLQRLFAHHLGHTPKDEYLNIRLTHARRLVEQSTLQFLEIALACGFECRAHFSKRFRRHFGKTPTELRRMGAKVNVAGIPPV